jgi:hypothetical protein
MIDPQELVDRLSERFELSTETQEKLLSRASLPTTKSENQTLQTNPAPIGFTTTVSTFIAQKNFHNFAVPRFASHWGVVCNFQEEGLDVKYLFHLLFNPETRKVTLDSTMWKEEWSRHHITYVGSTPYRIAKVSNIGTC